MQSTGECDVCPGEKMVEKDRLTLILDRAKRLDPTAYDELVAIYAPRLYGLMCKLTGGQQDVEDMVQEVFIRVVKGIERYEHDGRFESWLFRIATNLARDEIRKRRRTPEIVSLADADGVDLPGTGASDRRRSSHQEPCSDLIRAEEIAGIEDAIAELSPPEREVILLRQYSNMSFAAIAEMMGTPVGTALARAHRALAKLRNCLEQNDEQ